MKPIEAAVEVEGGGGGSALPFDLKTVMVGLWRRRLMLLAVVIVAPVLGALAGSFLGKRTYETETVLLYQPSSWARGGTADAPNLRTFVSMVKIQSNLEETRQRMKTGATIATLSAATEVQVQKETTLMSIRARWNTAQGAADLANTLRSVYLDSQIRVRRNDAQRQIQDQEGRLRVVERQLNDADAALQKYVADNRIVDLDKELNRYLEEYTSIDILYQQAQADKKTVDLQAANIDKVIDDLKGRVAKEENSSSQMESLGDLNIRSQRLRESIHDDRSQRQNMLDLAKSQVELERAEQLLKKGAISQAEAEQARATFEKQKTATLDTPQIKAWKDELARIDKTVLPKAGGNTPTAPILKDMMMRQFSIQLDRVSMTEKVHHLEKVRKGLKDKLEARAGLQRGYQALVREISAREVEKKALEQSLAQARRAYESEAADFTVIAEAPVPTQPLKSDKKIVTMAVTALLLLLGMGALVGMELSDPTVKSPAEASLRLRTPVMAALPRISSSVLHDDVPVDQPVFDTLRLMARRLEHGEVGRSILLTSGTPHEGTSFVVGHLAQCLERQDRKVLVVDCAIRRPASGSTPQGLSDLLDGTVDDLDTLLQPGPLPNISVLGAGRSQGSADRLGSMRMGALIGEVSRRFDLVLLDCPSLQAHVEADLLSRWVDDVVLVVKARGPRIATVSRLMNRLQEGAARVSGLVVNQVDTLYLERT